MFRLHFFGRDLVACGEIVEYQRDSCCTMVCLALDTFGMVWFPMADITVIRRPI